MNKGEEEKRNVELETAGILTDTMQKSPGVEIF